MMTKNLKKLISLACGVVLTAGLLAGCGNNSTNKKANNKQNKPSVEKKEEAKNDKKDDGKNEAKVEIALWDQDEAAAQETIDKIIDEFQKKNPNITVKRSHYETEDLRKNYTSAAMSGTGPDIILGPNDNLGVFVTGGLVQPVDEVLGKDFLNQFDSNALEAAKYLGKQYMLPDRNGNELLLIYNKDLVAEAPVTWEKLEEAGKALQGKGEVEYVVAFNEVEPFFTVPFLKAFGGEVFDDVNAEKPKPTLNTEAMKQWAEFLIRIHDEKIIPKEADYDVAFNLFKEGKVPFLINGPWCINDLKAANMNFDFTAIPSINGNDCAAYSAVKGYTISESVKGEKKEAVKKFLLFLNNKENQLLMVDAHKQLPTNLEAIKDSKITDDAMIANQKTALDKCIPMPIIPQMRAIWDSMKPVQQEIFAGKIKAEDVPTKMQKLAEDGVKALGF
jgi:maltose-binding protein MalE